MHTSKITRRVKRRYPYAPLTNAKKRGLNFDEAVRKYLDSKKHNYESPEVQTVREETERHLAARRKIRFTGISDTMSNRKRKRPSDLRSNRKR